MAETTLTHATPDEERAVSTNNRPTNFAESNALLAVQSDDHEEAARILADMLPGELDALADAAEELADMARARHLTGLRPAWAQS